MTRMSPGYVRPFALLRICAVLLRMAIGTASATFLDMQIKDRSGKNLVSGDTARTACESTKALRRADLACLHLRRADLRGADLRGADLTGTDLLSADLRGANLREARLERADLRGADLRGADLRGAVLRGARLERAAF